MSVTSNIGLWLYQIGTKFRITQNSDSLNKNFEKIDSVVGAVPSGRSLQEEVGSVPSGKSLQGQIGDTELPTTAQTLTGAIAEHEQDLISQNQAIGNLSNLTTTEKGSLVGAANELNSNISTINGSIDQNITSGRDLNDYKTTGIWRIGNMSALINKATVSGVGTTGILYVIKIGSYILQDFPNNGVRATRFSFDGGSNWDSWH